MSSSQHSSGLVHGASRLPAVQVDAYNAELRDDDGFLGDRANKRAFHVILDDWRDRVRRVGEDPFGDKPSAEIGRRRLVRALDEGDVECAGLILSAIEEFAQEFATVCRRLLRLKAWQDTQRIVIGGGFSGSRLGELAISRAAVLLKSDGRPIEIRLIRHDRDEAALIGALHMVPHWMFAGHDAAIGVDIGGTNMRAGVVRFAADGTVDLANAAVVRSERWRHADESPTREEAVERLTRMLRGLITFADRKGLRLAPFVGVGCPGVIQADGSIEKGGQNLPGNWESKRFNLPDRLREALPRIDGHDPMVLLHNDAVLQGLAEVPWMQDVQHWAVLTIGTGLGNACFSNVAADDDADR